MRRLFWCLFILSLLFFRLGSFNVFAQQYPEETIREVINEATKESSNLKDRLAIRQETIDRKNALIDLLKEDLNVERQKSNPDQFIVSMAAFELLMAEGRLLFEELKLWKIEKMLEIQSESLDSAMVDAAKVFLTELEENTQEKIHQIQMLADDLSDLISHPLVEAQYKKYMKKLADE